MDLQDATKAGIRHLKKRIQSSSQAVMVLAAGIIVPLLVDHSTNKQHPMHLPTVLCTYFTVLSGLSLRGLVGECFNPGPVPWWYLTVKVLLHACALLLVSLTFSLSLMMRMNAVATSLTLAAAAAYVAHRLWQCKATELDEDVRAYMGCEEKLQQLLELSTNVTCMLFSGWFGLAFFYFQQNDPEDAGGGEARARLLPSEHLTFLTSVAASLMLPKAVPRRLAPACPRPVMELMALTCALVGGVAATSLAVAAYKVGGYAALALVPEAIALAAWCGQRSSESQVLPAWFGGGAAQDDEPPSHNLVGVPLAVPLAVLFYRAKGVPGLSSLYDEAFVLVTTAAVVAALGWRLLTQPPTPVQAPGVQAAAKILAFFTFLLLLLSVLAFLGVMFGW